MVARQRGFGQQWLFGRLTQLLPDFPDVRLCVALSGGVDSSALLAALATPRHALPELRAVHVDHGLHPNSRRWSEHCRALARRVNVPLQVLATKVRRARGESLEAVARDARYALLEANLAPGEVLLTAHHEDDQLETVLLQLFRGSGVAGLSGMPELTGFGRGFLARPLLGCTRAQLEEWARSRGLEWIEDDTNADEALDRNYLRRRVLPLVRARWPGIATAVGRSARHAAQAQRLLDEVARRDVERAADGDCLAASALRGLTPERRRNALRYWISRAGFPVPDTRRLDEICGPLLEARPDANPAVTWGAVVLRRERGRVSIAAAARASAAPGMRGESRAGLARRASAAAARATPSAGGALRGSQRAEPVGAVTWNWAERATCEVPNAGQLELTQDPRGPLDLDALPTSLMVRTRLGGERLRPRKGGPARALKSLLQEAHVPPGERACLPLVCSGGRLLAVADLWLDESVQADPAAQRRARLLWRR